MRKSFGFISTNDEAYLYSLKNKNGMQVDVTNYGAAIVNCIVKDKNGEYVDVVLGHDNAADYETGTAFMGAVLGRNSNRISNAEFFINEKKYKLDKNNGMNNLHSGNDFYNKRLWNVNEIDESSISFYLESPHMDQGYPGDATIEVVYAVTDNNELSIKYYAKCNKDTIMNLTNHSYFNLHGHSDVNILDQYMWLNADGYTESDEYLVPTGNIIDVTGTPMDFRTPKTIGKDIYCDYAPLIQAGGYDHNFVLNEYGTFRKVASLYSEKTGITMTITSDRPGMQIYTSNVIENLPGKLNSIYNKYQGVCFETQFFPDSINQKKFESPILEADKIYSSCTVFKFDV